MPKKQSKELIVKEGTIILPPATLSLVPEQGRLLMEAMNGDIDEWAIQERPGPGGKPLKYLPHGYIRDILNRTFGPFWSFRTLDIEPGKKFSVIEYEKSGKTAREIIVTGELTIRIYVDGKFEEMVTTGSGGKVWENNIPFADALQSAESEAFKRCAFPRGRKLGLALYYDNEERRLEWQEKLNPKPPKSFSQLIDRLTTEEISPEQWATVTGKELDDIEPTDDIEALWNLYTSSVQIVTEGQ